jgi:hypothetical protein
LRIQSETSMKNKRANFLSLLYFLILIGCAIFFAIIVKIEIISTILKIFFIIPNCSKIVNDPKILIENLREDLWNALQKIVDRSRKIDAPKLIAVDVVTKVVKHLQKIRDIQLRM